MQLQHGMCIRSRRKADCKCAAGAFAGGVSTHGTGSSLQSRRPRSQGTRWLWGCPVAGPHPVLAEQLPGPSEPGKNPSAPMIALKTPITRLNGRVNYQSGTFLCGEQLKFCLFYTLKHGTPLRTPMLLAGSKIPRKAAAQFMPNKERERYNRRSQAYKCASAAVVPLTTAAYTHYQHVSSAELTANLSSHENLQRGASWRAGLGQVRRTI